ncbi:hypothetical protein FPV67DRAFT_1444511 [Lyophyllum atratum]|nr:hypothetical protein FPV67DRAFT_1444511 [Lyophyllum atratum]
MPFFEGASGVHVVSGTFQDIQVAGNHNVYNYGSVHNENSDNTKINTTSNASGGPVLPGGGSPAWKDTANQNLARDEQKVLEKKLARQTRMETVEAGALNLGRFLAMRRCWKFAGLLKPDSGVVISREVPQTKSQEDGDDGSIDISQRSVSGPELGNSRFTGGPMTLEGPWIMERPVFHETLIFFKFVCRNLFVVQETVDQRWPNRMKLEDDAWSGNCYHP